MDRLGYSAEQLVGGDFTPIIPEAMMKPHEATFYNMNFNRGVLSKRDLKVLPISRSDRFIQPSFVYMKMMP